MTVVKLISVNYETMLAGSSSLELARGVRRAGS
jgi:hypothetical protein